MYESSPNQLIVTYQMNAGTASQWPSCGKLSQYSPELSWRSRSRVMSSDQSSWMNHCLRPMANSSRPPTASPIQNTLLAQRSVERSVTATCPRPGRPPTSPVDDTSSGC